MDTNKNFEKPLSDLPRYKLSLKTDLKIRFKLFLASYNDFFAKYYKMAVSLAVFLFLIIGIAGYSYTSPSVVSGSAFYPIKQTLENIALKLAFSNSQKINSYITFGQRRLKEAKYLAQKRHQYSSDKTVFGIIPKVYAASIKSYSNSNTKRVYKNFSYSKDPLTKTLYNVYDNSQKAISCAQEIKKPEKLQSNLHKIIAFNEQSLYNFNNIINKLYTDSTDEVFDALAIYLRDFEYNQKNILNALSDYRQAIQTQNNKIDIALTLNQDKPLILKKKILGKKQELILKELESFKKYYKPEQKNKGFKLENKIDIINETLTLMEESINKKDYASAFFLLKKAQGLMIHIRFIRSSRL
jgi:hypothetical protein